ncbi:hypothetical protein [Mycolicibacterium pyrenivorans]|uniref:hypothetical protein n=1 Tax=Mycolicibacterium pyrenivorans TaxID=187102 RepID=UPI0021F3AE98|nr:hypothetical protein [Mycolicibacterium pyrenivorans]MCV7154347.1 hypothetical protein [Mycolicibacterium pyrenivorans]
MAQLTAEVEAALNERSSQVVADRLVRQMTQAGKVSGEAFSKALQDEANRTGIAMDKIRGDIENKFRDHGRTAGRGFGSSFGSELASALPLVGGFQSAMAGYETAIGETFMLNGSALGDPSASWLGRLAGAAAGVRPALPNTAGEMGGEQNENMAEAGKKPPRRSLRSRPRRSRKPWGPARKPSGRATSTRSTSTTRRSATCRALPATCRAR